MAERVVHEPTEPWRAARWCRQGYDRLYVHAANGASIGWYDLGSGDLHAIEPPHTEALTRFVVAWLDSAEARALGPLPAPHPPPPPLPVRHRFGRRAR